jgi:hypothetical protein
VGENTDTVLRNTKTSKEIGMEVNPEKTKYMLMSRYQKAGQAEHRDSEQVLLRRGEVQIFGNNT